MCTAYAGLHTAMKSWLNVLHARGGIIRTVHRYPKMQLLGMMTGTAPIVLAKSKPMWEVKCVYGKYGSLLFTLLFTIYIALHV